MIEAVDLYKSFGSAQTTLTEVLKGINLTIETGEFSAIVGKSGSGKSTLLNLLSTLQKPSGGHVLYEGEDVYLFKTAALAHFRNKTIGFIFQEHHLFYELTALENVLVPASIAGEEKKIRERAEYLLNRVHLGDRIHFKPSQLSGGQCQRVAIARALLNYPQYIFADEPTGSLDTHSSQEVFELLKTVNKEERTTIIMVTHNKELSTKVDRVITIQDGKIFQG